MHDHKTNCKQYLYCFLLLLYSQWFLEIIAILLEVIFTVGLKRWQRKKTSVKRMMYSFIWFLNNIKKCYFYLNKSHLVAGEHCKSYKLKSEVFTNHTCWMHLRTREGIFARTLASHHCGWVISRTLLLMSAKIFVDPRLFSRRSSTGSPCFFFLLN